MEQQLTKTQIQKAFREYQDGYALDATTKQRLEDVGASIVFFMTFHEYPGHVVFKSPLRAVLHVAIQDQYSRKKKTIETVGMHGFDIVEHGSPESNDHMLRLDSSWAKHCFSDVIRLDRPSNLSMTMLQINEYISEKEQQILTAQLKQAQGTASSTKKPRSL